MSPSSSGSPRKIAPATGKLGVLTVGLGAVSSTLIAGVELAKRGMATPIGSLAQMGSIRLGKRTDNRSPMIKDFVPLAKLEDIEWGAWDPFPDDAYVAAQRAGVLEGPRHIEAISDTLRAIRPMKAAFDREYVKNISADNTLGTINKRAMLNAIREDINRFRDEKKVDRMVMIWFHGEVHRAGPRTPRPGKFRKGNRCQRPHHRSVNVVRVRSNSRRYSVRQWCSEPGRRHSGATRSCHQARRCHQR
jgi:hypothetical protein